MGYAEDWGRLFKPGDRVQVTFPDGETLEVGYAMSSGKRGFVVEAQYIPHHLSKPSWVKVKFDDGSISKLSHWHLRLLDVVERIAEA